MNDMVIFGIGVFVTSMVTSAIGLLAWAAWTTEDSALSRAREQEVLRLVKPKPAPLESRGVSGRQTG